GKIAPKKLNYLKMITFGLTEALAWQYYNARASLYLRFFPEIPFLPDVALDPTFTTAYVPDAAYKRLS
ncbi:hypothetical protein, partial [Xenorhabdus bovienii]|uniref:hypothetical protein n=1 Tax=Xenorhabdus bovienii TaxID=40576 RepID=UPI0023B22119